MDEETKKNKKQKTNHYLFRIRLGACRGIIKLERDTKREKDGLLTKDKYKGLNLEGLSRCSQVYDGTKAMHIRRMCTLNFVFLFFFFFFPGLVASNMHYDILCSSPIKPCDLKVNNRYTYSHSVPRQPFCFSILVTAFSKSHVVFNTLL